MKSASVELEREDFEPTPLRVVSQPEPEGLPINPSHVRPDQFSLSLDGYDIISLWESKLIGEDVAILLILKGLCEMYGDRRHEQMIRMAEFEFARFARNWETLPDDKERTKEFSSEKFLAVLKKLEKAGKGLHYGAQLTLDLEVGL